LRRRQSSRTRKMRCLDIASRCSLRSVGLRLAKPRRRPPTHTGVVTARKNAKRIPSLAFSLAEPMKRASPAR
jgi:hypothetical protein